METRKIKLTRKQVQAILNTVGRPITEADIRALCDTALALWDRGNHTYPHMCRMDHIEIGHADSGDDERCPLCRAIDDADAWELKNAQNVGKYEKEVDCLREALREIDRTGPTYESAGEECRSIARTALEADNA